MNSVNYKLLSLLIVGLLLSQASYSATYPLTIAPGRSWPLSVVADSSRGLIYFDATSGLYPPTGFSFGIINATSHDVVKILPLDVNPGAMVLDQSSGDVYVAGNNSIAVFDEGNQSFVHDLVLGHPILSMAFDSSVSSDLFVTSGHSLLSLDPHTGSILGNSSFSNPLDGVQIDPSNGRLFVGQYPNSEISVLNASNLVSIGNIGLPGCCALQFALDVGTQSLYAATGTNYVYLVNAATDTFEKSIQVAPSAENSTNSIVVDNETGRVYVASSLGGSITELDVSSGAVADHFQAQYQVAGLAVDTKTEELYASNYHQITVFDANRPRIRVFGIAIIVIVAAAAVLVVYLLIRRRENRERMRVQSGWSKNGPPQG